MIRKRRSEKSGTLFETAMRDGRRAMLPGARRLIRAPLVICAICVLCGTLKAQTLTTVSDTLHGPDGAPLSGTITISSGSTFTAADGTVVPKGTVATVQVTNGTFSVALVPNAGSTPSGTSYRALYNLGRAYLSETWVVPTSASPVDLASVRTASAPSPSVQFSINQVTPPGGCNGQLTWVNSAWSCAQPSFSGISGQLSNSQLPSPLASSQILQTPSANEGTTSNFPNLGTLYIRDVPIMDDTASGGWHYNYTGDPWVFEDGGSYYMYFYGESGAGVFASGYATSDNLIDWAEAGSNPVFKPGSGYDSLYAAKPSIVKIGSTYYAYVEAQNSSNIRSIGLFTASSPGGPWTDQGEVFAPGSEPGGYTTISLEAPTVYKDGSTYYLFYTGQLAAPDYRWPVFYATSTDGVSWTRQGVAIQPGSAGTWDVGGLGSGRIIRVGNYYVMGANGMSTTSSSVNQEGQSGGIGLFYSTDLVNWTEYSRDPLIPADNGTSGGVFGGNWKPYRCQLLDAQGTIWMFFNMSGTYWAGNRPGVQQERIYLARFGSPFPSGNMTIDQDLAFTGTNVGIGQRFNPEGPGTDTTYQLSVTNGPGQSNVGQGLEVYGDNMSNRYISMADKTTGALWTFSMRTDDTMQVYFNSNGTTPGWHEYFLFDKNGDLISLPVSFSALPACNSAAEGAERAIKDSTVNTWGSTITGGGTYHVLGYCDATNWTVAAK